MAQYSSFGVRGPVTLPGFMIVPHGAKIHYVHHNGPGAFTDLPPECQVVYTSIQAALTAVENDRGDIVQLLPGHTENIASATYFTQTVTTLPRGFTIKGPQTGKPAVLTWSVAAASMAISSADVTIDGSRADGRFGIDLQMAGPSGTTAITVAAPIVISAARCGIIGCFMNVGIDNDQLCTIGITTTASASQLVIRDNVVRGNAAALITTWLRLVGCTDPVITNNDVVCGTSAAAVGPIQMLTTASTGVTIAGNFVHNIAASSTGCITGVASATGVISDNRLRNQTDASVAHIPTPANMQLFQNYGVNNNGETGILIGTPSV